MTTIHTSRIIATALSLATLELEAGCTEHAPLDTLAADGSNGSTSDSTSGTSPAPTSETGAPAECPADRTCVPAVESGWAGPMVARENTGDFELACESPFSAPFATLHAGLVAPPPICTCDCEADGSPACDPVTELAQFDGNVCAGPPDSWLVSSSCNPAVAAAPNTAVSAEEVAVIGVSCEPSHSEQIAPASFVRTIMMCATPASPASPPVDACSEGGEAGECAPTFDPKTEQICIAREGDVACPEAWDRERHLYHRDFEDDRACSDCSCTEFSGTCSGVTIVVFGSNDCSGTPVGGVTPGSCEQLANQGASSGRRSGVGVPDVDCSGNAVGGDPIGSAKATSPFTVCCLPR